MNFLAQVLATAGEAEIVDLKQKLTELEKKVGSLDVEVKDYLENSYTKFAVLSPGNHFTFRVKDLLTDIDQLQNRIKTQVKRELESSVNDSKNLTVKLNETNACLRIVKQLLDIDESIRTAEDDQSRRCYLAAAKKFKHIKELLSDDEHLKNLNIYESLAYYAQNLHDKFLYDSLVVWNSYVNWEEHTLSNNSKKITLTVNNADGNFDVICVLLYYDYLDYEVRSLGKKLFDGLLVPIIKYKRYKTTVKVNSNDDITEVIFECKENEMEDDSMDDKVVEKLNVIFRTLFESLDVFISEDETFVNRLGEFFEAEFCDCLVEYYLYEVIPTKKENLSLFGDTVDSVIKFDSYLKEIGFLKPTNDTIPDYLKDADSLFLEKTSKNYLVKARKIFAQDLHDTIQIPSFFNDKKSIKNDVKDTDLAVCKNIMQRPNCYISKSTNEILDLIQVGLKEIKNSDDTRQSIKLFRTMRDVVTLYCDLMPLIHSNLLKSIPQQSALFYNNCMYLAHELTLLNFQISNLFSDEIIATFIDFIEPLRSEACKVLDSQVELQQRQLLEILTNSGLASLVGQTEFPPSIEKSLRQCLRQMSLLQSVWQNILPQNIYSKLIGVICNVFLEKLFDSILILDDITVNTASQLTDVFTIVQTNIPELFQEPKEVFKFIKSWMKFGELLIILNGTLKDIDDRWADGKGPLAQELSPDQIEHLVRALFQHTDRRSAFLSKIK